MKRLVLFLLAITLFGCSAGVDFLYKNVTQLQLNITQDSQIVELLGEPYQVTEMTTKNGTFKEYSYIYKESANIAGTLITGYRVLYVEMKEELLNGFFYVDAFKDSKTTIDLSKADQIKVGITSQTDLITIFGEPHGEINLPTALAELDYAEENFSRVWIWSEDNLEHELYDTKNRTKSLMVFFDSNGNIVELEAANDMKSKYLTN